MQRRKFQYTRARYYGQKLREMIGNPHCSISKLDKLATELGFLPVSDTPHIDPITVPLIKRRMREMGVHGHLHLTVALYRHLTGNDPSLHLWEHEPIEVPTLLQRTADFALCHIDCEELDSLPIDLRPTTTKQVSCITCKRAWVPSAGLIDSCVGWYCSDQCMARSSAQYANGMIEKLEEACAFYGKANNTVSYPTILYQCLMSFGLWRTACEFLEHDLPSSEYRQHFSTKVWKRALGQQYMPFPWEYVNTRDQ